LAEAGRALAELQSNGSMPSGSRSAWQAIDVSAPDRDALLVDWLNELIYRAESEGYLPTDFEFDEVTPTRARGRIRGPFVEIRPHRVKAATHHRLTVHDAEPGVEAEVLLDV
jgi:SHS2 domain-containing protein